MGPKNPAEVIPDHPSKICYRPVRLPIPLEEQSDIVKVSHRQAWDDLRTLEMLVYHLDDKKGVLNKTSGS